MLIRTVLCPLDFSALSIAEVQLATDLCRAFGAKLVVHHNLTDAGPGVAMGWMWQQDRRGITPELLAEQRLRELLEELPAELEPRAVLTRGVAASSILAVQQQVHADLVLLATHGASSEDHASVTENVVASCACPVLALHESTSEGWSWTLPPSAEGPWTVLVPTDLSAESRACVHFAGALAAKWPLHLHLLHVVATEWTGPTARRREEEVYARLRALLPTDTERTGRCHLRFGDPSTQIAQAAEVLGAQAIVMGAHARGLLRGFLTADTSRQVLQRTQCPIWVVPSSWAA